MFKTVRRFCLAPHSICELLLKQSWQRYSTNDLELIAVVWALEQFKYYLYGAHFKLQTDNQALLSALKKNRGNKTYQSSLTRFVDRLLPFHFSIEHIPGKKMGFAYYLPLDANIQEYCNFSILGGKATGIYRFINGFYGLTDMLATFRKIIDKTLEIVHSKFAFLDNILIITKSSLNGHEQEIDKVLNLLDKEKLAIKLQKCEFAKPNLTWLGLKLHPN